MLGGAEVVDAVDVAGLAAGADVAVGAVVDGAVVPNAGLVVPPSVPPAFPCGGGTDPPPAPDPMAQGGSSRPDSRTITALASARLLAWIPASTWMRAAGSRSDSLMGVQSTAPAHESSWKEENCTPTSDPFTPR